MQRKRPTRRAGSRPAMPAWLRRLAVPARLGLLAAVLVALAGLAAACDDGLELQRRFAACMREQGIEFPDPTRDGDGISGPAGPFDGDWEAFEAAREFCEAETGFRTN